MDSLTNIYNRYGFDELAEKMIAKNPKSHFVVALLDIDDFKFINDIYGHAYGDKALKNLADSMKNFFPSNALLGRNGGDEFCIFLPNCTYDDVKEQLQQFVKIPKVFSCNGKEYQFYISLGYAEYPTFASNRSEYKLWIAAALFAVGMIFEERLDALLTPFVAKAVFFGIPYLLCGLSVLKKGLQSLLKFDFFNEYTLMGGATIAAAAIGQLPEAVGVMLFYSIGEALQDRAAGNSRRSIRALLAARPTVAHLIEEKDGKQMVNDADPSEIRPGMRILVKPGEKIPLDGTVLTGSSQVDTSPLTGESVPVSVGAGKQVYAGTVNLEGAITVEVTSRFADSSVARILELVEQASANKAPIERFITRFARYYTPAVVFIAALVAVIPPLAGHGTFDEWLYRALVLLVISCPCALVISIPLGYFGGIGAASKKGILVKGGHVLDALHNIKTVAFDKTGTLTRGVFEVTRVLPAEGASEEDVLNAARLVESRSTHPIARAIMKTAPGSHGFALEAVESKEIPGKGLSAEHKGRTLLVGNALLLQDAGISVPSLPAGQGSVVYVAVGNAYLGAIEVSDVLRPESAPAIESLRRQGIERLVMLTGDRPESAAIVAKELHLDEYRAGLLPEGKAAELESLGPRQSVLFVGDGINDAPVLAMSGVGVAMGGLGSEAAIEVADAVILDDSPSRLPEMFSIAAKTRVVVWQNIVMALGIKGLFMVLGVVGLSGLWEAVFADVGVALLAVLNATRTAR